MRKHPLHRSTQSHPDLDENPRQGLRTEAGAIQLQAHDAQTDLEFRAVRAAEWR